MLSRVEISNHVFNELRESDRVESITDRDDSLSHLLRGEYGNNRCIEFRLYGVEAQFYAFVSGEHSEGFRLELMLDSDTTGLVKLADLNRVLAARECSDVFYFGHSEDYYVDTFDRVFSLALSSAVDIIRDNISRIAQEYDHAQRAAQEAASNLEAVQSEFHRAQSLEDSIEHVMVD